MMAFVRGLLPSEMDIIVPEVESTLTASGLIDPFRVPRIDLRTAGHHSSTLCSDHFRGVSGTDADIDTNVDANTHPLDSTRIVRHPCVPRSTPRNAIDTRLDLTVIGFSSASRK